MWCTCSVIMLHRVSRHWGRTARRLSKDTMMHMQHEAALTKAEATLEEDSAAFDKFLKESDEKVQQAMAKADAEMRAKQEKVIFGNVKTSKTGHLTRESTRPWPTPESPWLAKHSACTGCCSDWITRCSYMHDPLAGSQYTVCWAGFTLKAHTALSVQANELKRLQNALGIMQAELRKAQEQYAECNRYCAILESHHAQIEVSLLMCTKDSMLPSTAQANELKRLQNALGIAQAELRKVQEQYAECNKYCAFLDSITPPEFFTQQANRYEAEWQVFLDNQTSPASTSSSVINAFVSQVI